MDNSYTEMLENNGIKTTAQTRRPHGTHFWEQNLTWADIPGIGPITLSHASICEREYGDATVVIEGTLHRGVCHHEKPKYPGIKRVIYNPPATIVFWEDGEKTIVKCMEGETFSPYFGLVSAIAKRVIGNNSRLHDIMWDKSNLEDWFKQNMQEVPKASTEEVKEDK